MALNISYSAWAVLFGLILLGTVPGPVEIVCCIAILCGTILAACDWDELFGRKKAGRRKHGYPFHLPERSPCNASAPRNRGALLR